MRASSQSSRQANLLQTFVWNAEHGGYRGRCKRLPRFVKSAAHRTTSLLIAFGVFVLASALALPAYALYTDGRTLVNNIGQTSTSSPSLLKDYTHAQGFRTGSHKFWLTGIEVEFETGGTHANQMDQVLATVNKATPSGTPGDAVAGLTATQASAGVTLLKTSWASEITILEANTDYVVVLWAGLINSTASVKLTDSDAEDSGGESGWSIADHGYHKERGSREAWTRSTSVKKIRVRGERFLTVSDAEATEGTNTTMDFTVTLSKPPGSGEEFNVNYYTVDGTAKDGNDYVYKRGSLRFTSGQTQKTVSVTIIDDDIEDDGETFQLFLTGGSLPTSKHGTGTIRNNEGRAPTVSVADAQATEGPGAMMDFAVKLDRALEDTVTVDYATADGTATAGADYTTTSGTLTFAPGDQRKTISVPIAQDAVEDDGETLTLTLSNISGAKLADAQATGTIRNNAPPTGAPTISGTPQVGEILTALVDDISDGNGLDNPAFAYSWFRKIDGGTYTLSCCGASTYTPKARDEGHAIYVTVSYTDGAGNREAVTSDPTAQVVPSSGNNVGNQPGDNTDPVQEETQPLPPAQLTASFVDMPASHDGPSTIFTLQLLFSEDPAVSFRTLRDTSFAVTGGTVKRALRVNGRNDLREIHIEPAGTDAVKITLAGGRACGTTGAICTSDGRPLSNTLKATVAGPALNFGLDVNYPNPFNPETQIPYTLSETGPVELAIYNIMGQRVRILVQSVQAAGRYQVVWDGRNDNGVRVASGIYLSRLSSVQGVQVRRLLLLK